MIDAWVRQQRDFYVQVAIDGTQGTRDLAGQMLLLRIKQYLIDQDRFKNFVAIRVVLAKLRAPIWTIRWD
jgi:hypothetical protein